MTTIKFKLLDPMAKLPSRGTVGSVGMDVSCVREVMIPARGRAVVQLGLSMEMPSTIWATFGSRSGLAFKSGISSFPGVIDSDYRGPLAVMLINDTDEDCTLEAGTRISQLIFVDAIYPAAVWADDLTETQRGCNGFGSTGL